MGAPERELWRRKCSRTLQSHLLHGKINRIGGISRCREERSSKSDFNYWHSQQKPTLGWGLGTETSAPEVSPREWEQAGVGGAETTWGPGTGLSSSRGRDCLGD